MAAGGFLLIVGLIRQNYGMKLSIIVEDKVRDLLQQFVDLGLVDAPPFDVAKNIRANDLDRIDGEMVTIPVSVVSFETGQKYLVPRGDGFLIPVPKGNNWAIYHVSSQVLERIIARLSTSPGASLDDFYDLVDGSGKLCRMYY